MDDENIEWDIKGKTDLEIRKDKANAIKAYEEDKKVISTGKGVSYEMKISIDGIDEYYEIIKNPVFNTDGKVIGIIGLINDITKRVLLEQKLQAQANYDEMTGLYNRSYYEYWLNNLNLESLYPLSIIIADCNDLKMLNDNYGHLVGDEYIKKTASVLSVLLPDDAYIFRIGGDEFLAFLPKTTEEEVQNYIYQIQRVLKTVRVKSLPLSVAIGSDTIKEYKSDLSEDIDKADQSMYKVKQLMKRNK